MAKPTGAACNLSCAYCYFLKKEQLYPGSRFRMGEEVLEQYLAQTIAAHRVPGVTIAWQGGEPTLMGLPFFRRAMDIERRHLRPGMRAEHTLQTNGVLLDEEWCRFFKQHEFLVGLSLDGPRELHDAHRRDRGGRGTFARVVRAARLMQEHGVQFNVLCTVSAVNSRHPLDVYRFFRDELGARYVQLIPIVERDNASGAQEGDAITSRSVRAEQYGRFLIDTFDEWLRRDVGEVFVQTFDGVLAAWLYGQSSLCVFRRSCGDGVALEHNGDLYSCDHFVEPGHLLGNILATPMGQLVGGAAQRAFGQAKWTTLPRYCRECEFLFACHGECPKNRVLTTPAGEPGLNWLCAGLKAFFAHVARPMAAMAGLLREGRPAREVMSLGPLRGRGKAGRNDPCPCGSGAKFKRCHGRGALAQ